MSTNDPAQIQQDIERTRGRLSDDVNELGDRVKPGNVARRQADRARGTVGNLRDRVMGSAGGDESSPTSAVSDAVSSGTDAAKSAPHAVRRQTQGNPLAAGLIAFGAGWLLSSVLPASSAEQEAASQVKDKAQDVAQPVMDQAKQAGQEMAENLKEPARHAADHVRSTAQDAAGNVSEQGKEAAGNVKDNAQQQAGS